MELLVTIPKDGIRTYLDMPLDSWGTDWQIIHEHIIDGSGYIEFWKLSDFWAD